MEEKAGPSRLVLGLSGLAALVYLASGGAKLAGADEALKAFERFGLGPGFMRLIGVAEVAGAIGLFIPKVAPVAAAGLAAIMVGAIGQHLMHDSVVDAVPALALLGICAFVAFSRHNEISGD